MSLGYKDPRWQQKRLEQFSYACWACQECGSTNNELNLHHYWYERGREVWDYPDECFVVLCDACHGFWHESKLKIDRKMQFSLSEMDQAYGLVAGLRCVTHVVDFYFESGIDGLTIAAVVRGFWPPAELQKNLIDHCLYKASQDEGFLLSDAVGFIVPVHEPKYAHVADWLCTVTNQD